MSIPSFQILHVDADMIETCRDVYPFLARHVDAGDIIETCCTPECTLFLSRHVDPDTMIETCRDDVIMQQ